MKPTLADIFQVFGINILAIHISFLDIEDFLKIFSLIFASAFTAWKWRVDYKKNRDEKLKKKHFRK